VQTKAAWGNPGYEIGFYYINCFVNVLMHSLSTLLDSPWYSFHLPSLFAQGMAGSDRSRLSLQYPHHWPKYSSNHSGPGETQSQCGQGGFFCHTVTHCSVDPNKRLNSRCVDFLINLLKSRVVNHGNKNHCKILSWPLTV